MLSSTTAGSFPSISCPGSSGRSSASSSSRSTTPGDPASWPGSPLRRGRTGAPILAAAAAWLECEVRQEVACGSHTLFVGRGRRAAAASRDGLEVAAHGGHPHELRRLTQPAGIHRLGSTGTGTVLSQPARAVSHGGGPVEPLLVTGPAALDSLVDRLLGADRYALDTEFHRERTYWPASGPGAGGLAGGRRPARPGWRSSTRWRSTWRRWRRSWPARG